MSEPRTWTPLELVRWTADYFKKHAIASPRLDAELLLAHALGVDRLALYTGFDKPVQEAERASFRALVRARAEQRMPVAYLTGVREFWSRSFQVTPDVLIPRPETELLIQAALELPARSVLELGVGSGAIAATFALERGDAAVLATDQSESALRVAAGNLERLGARSRVALVCAAGLDAIRGRFDLLISNPPYIPSPALAGLAPELHHEPRLALDGGQDGLVHITTLLREAARLVPGGYLALEIGEGQAPRVSELARVSGAKEIALHRDLAERERVLVARY